MPRYVIVEGNQVTNVILADEAFVEREHRIKGRLAILSDEAGPGWTATQTPTGVQLTPPPPPPPLPPSPAESLRAARKAAVLADPAVPTSLKAFVEIL